MTTAEPGVRLLHGLSVVLETQSFALRALLGSLAAAALAAVLVRLRVVRTPRARRLLILAPIATAAVAAAASVGEEFLPQVLVTGPAGESMEVLGYEVPWRPLAVLLVLYVAVAAFLVLRRLLGLLAVHRLLRAATPLEDPGIEGVTRRLAAQMRVRAPRLATLEHCPGGAFAYGSRRPRIALDPDLLERLDHRELEGLLAHELAHVARRDGATGLIVGLVRDLTFFLPALHTAVRWLREEQEQSADELASLHTRRPASLASSILKVWDSRSGRMAAPVCATMTPSVALLHRPPVLPWRRGAMQRASTAIADRVERLIERPPAVSAWRRRAEVVLALGVAVTAGTAAVAGPGLLPEEARAFGFGYFALPTPTAPVDSPALQAFRASTTPLQDVVATPQAATTAVSGCGLCVESAAQYFDGEAASGPARAAGWEANGSPRPLWELPAATSTAPSAQQLWGVERNGQHLSFIVVSGREAGA